MDIFAQVRELLGKGGAIEAWRLLSEALDVDTGNPHLTLAALHLARELGLHKEHGMLMKRAMTLASTPLVLCHLGDMLREQGKLAQARRLYHRAVALEGEYPAAWRGLALVERDRGRTGEALALLRRYRDAAPDDPWAREEEGLLLDGEGRPREAVDLLKSIDTPGARLHAAEILLREGDRDGAGALLEEAHALDADDLRVLYRLAKWREGEGDPDGAARLIDAFAARFSEPRLLDPQRFELSREGARDALLGSLAAGHLGGEFRSLASQKVALMESGRGVLHPLRGVEELRGFQIRLVYYVPAGASPREGFEDEIAGLMRDLVRFLDGLSGEGKFACSFLGLRQGERGFEELRRAILLRNAQSLAGDAGARKVKKRGEALVLLVESRQGDGGAEERSADIGFGGFRHVVLRWGRARATFSSSLAHEIVHAVLDTGHTDGEKDLRDPFSLMGEIGEDNPLPLAYLSILQRLRLVTWPAVQALVERAGRLERRALRTQTLPFGERRLLARKALAAYRSAQDSDPLYLGTYPRAAALCLFLNDTGGAVGQMERLFSLYPIADHCAKIAEILVNEGKPGTAVRLFERALGYGTSHLVYQRMGIAFSRGCRFREARRYFAKALAMSPREPSNIFNMAMYWHGVCRFDKAREYYCRALRIEGRWPQVRNRLALLYAQMGRPDEAREELRKARALRPTGMDLHYFTGRTLFQAGEARAAIEAMERAIRIEPQEQGSHYYLGYFLLCGGGDTIAVLRAFRRAFELERISFIGEAAFGFIAFLEGDCRGALQRAEALLRRNPHHSMVMALGLLCCMSLDDFTGRERYGRLLEKHEPLNPLLRAITPCG